MVLTRKMSGRDNFIDERSDSDPEPHDNEIESLKHEVERLKEELRKERRKYRSLDNNRSQARKIKRLEEKHAIDKVRIASFKKQLAATELEADARELIGGNGLPLGTPGFSDLMRTLLRRFCDLMVVTTMESEKSECLVCLETRPFTEFSSFPCEHSVCNTCLPSLPLVAGNISCPTCRGLSSYEEHEQVTYTEVGRWDALLEVAKEWAKVDSKSDNESSEGGFMDDGEQTDPGAGEETTSDDSRSGIVDIDATQDLSIEGTSQERQQSSGARATTPPSKPHLYSSLTPQQKKRRMEDMVRGRLSKGR